MLTVLMGLLASASASPVPLTDLSHQADRVVMGEVLITHTEQDSTGAFTIATVRVWETLRGVAAHVVDVRLPGAAFNHQDLTVHGQPTLLPGQDVVLFLSGDQLVGMGAGAFLLEGERLLNSNVARLSRSPLRIGTQEDPLFASHDIQAVRAALR